MVKKAPQIIPSFCRSLERPQLRRPLSNHTMTFTSHPHQFCFTPFTPFLHPLPLEGGRGRGGFIIDRAGSPLVSRSRRFPAGSIPSSTWHGVYVCVCVCDHCYVIFSRSFYWSSLRFPACPSPHVRYHTTYRASPHHSFPVPTRPACLLLCLLYPEFVVFFVFR